MFKHVNYSLFHRRATNYLVFIPEHGVITLFIYHLLNFCIKLHFSLSFLEKTLKEVGAFHILVHTQIKECRTGGYLLTLKDMKRLHGKERAVAFVNLSDEEQTMTVDYRLLDLEGGSKTITLPAHATRVLIAKGRRLQRRLYEAETAFLTDYQELNNNRAYMTAIYEQDSLCSGGVKASWLGGRATNDLIWHDVYVEKDGYYTLRIAALTKEPRKLYVDVNGLSVGSLTFTADDQQTIVAELKKGRNTVRLHNDHERMPDVDYMSVETK